VTDVEVVHAIYAAMAAREIDTPAMLEARGRLS